MNPYRWWKGRQITKTFMAQFARERIEQLTAEAEKGPLMTSCDVARYLSVPCVHGTLCTGPNLNAKTPT